MIPIRAPRFLNQPLLLWNAFQPSILEGLQIHLRTPEAFNPKETKSRNRLYDVCNSVAVIPVDGVLVSKAALYCDETANN